MMLLRALALWYASRLLVTEIGPARIFLRFRELTGVKHTEDDQIDKMLPATNDLTPLSCVYCTVMWLSLPMLLAPKWVVSVLSLAGAATLIQDGLREK